MLDVLADLLIVAWIAYVLGELVFLAWKVRTVGAALSNNRRVRVFIVTIVVWLVEAGLRTA